MSWEPGPPARHTSARAAWRPQNLEDGAMKKILISAAPFGRRRGPSGAGTTEIPGEVPYGTDGSRHTGRRHVISVGRRIDCL